jgi:hypothetical protein
MPIMNWHVRGACREIVPEILDELELLGWAKVENGRATHGHFQLGLRYDGLAA